MRTESEIRQQGFEWDNIERSFIWQNLNGDLIRELAQCDPTYKTILQHHLIAALQGFASYPSKFFQNMYIYLKLDLAEQNELKNYIERVGMMYMQQLNKELESRHTYSVIDQCGMVQDQIII